MDPSKYESLRNQTLLFFVEKLIDTKHRTLHDLSCQFGSKGFTKEMRQIAGSSQAGLKKFLEEYPSLFSLEGELVMYKDTSINSKITKDNSEPQGKEAVEYFRERLIQYGIGVWVPIKSLLGHRSQAPSEVRHVSGQHINEFRSFLERFPLVFKLNDENVLLKEFENENISTTISENNNPSVNLDKDKILKLIEFYGNCLTERGPMLVEQLFHASAVGLGGEGEEFFVKNPADLKSFFQLHPQCFTVHSNLVTINADSYKVGLEYLQIQKPKCHNSNESQPNVTLKPFIIPLYSATPQPVTPPISTTLTEQKDTLKSRFSKILMKTLTENSSLDNNNTKTKLIYEENKFPEFLSSFNEDENLLKNYLINRSLIVSNVRKGKSIIDEILSAKNVVAVDCEGVNLGEGGKITLIQIGNSRGAVFIFDLLTQPGLSSEVKRLLEDESVIKVMHDCRNDSVNLYKEFGIRLKNIFDTQAAHVVIQNEDSNKIKNISLNNLCSVYANYLHNPFKDKIKGVYRHDGRYWSRRPLTKQMISYCACDVLCLVPYVYNEMNARIKTQADKILLQNLTEEQILSHIQPDEIRQRRRIRKNESDLGELKTKIEDALENDASIVLSNREMRLLKHLELSELAKEKLKTSLKVAKKLEKMERGNVSLENDSSSSELTSLEYNDERVQKIDDLEAIISEIITQQDNNSFTEHNSNNYDHHLDLFTKSVAVQTASTGDIVVMKIYEE